MLKTVDRPANPASRMQTRISQPASHSSHLAARDASDAEGGHGTMARSPVLNTRGDSKGPAGEWTRSLEMWGRSEDRVRRAPGPEWGAPLIIGGPGGVPLSIHHPHPPIHPRMETRHVRRYLTWIQVVRWIGCAFWPLEVCNRGTF